MATAAKKRTAVRIDPPQRPIDASGLPYFTVVNKDPDRDYKLVYKGAGAQFGVEYYEYLGYEIEVHREGGPRFAQGKPKPGEVMENFGHVLMSCTRERADQITEYGTDGISGQAAADALEKKMLNNKKHVLDLMRGVDNRMPSGERGFYVESDAGSLASIPKGDEHG